MPSDPETFSALLLRLPHGLKKQWTDVLSETKTPQNAAAKMLFEWFVKQPRDTRLAVFRGESLTPSAQPDAESTATPDVAGKITPTKPRKFHASTPKGIAASKQLGKK